MKQQKAVSQNGFGSFWLLDAPTGQDRTVVVLFLLLLSFVHFVFSRRSLSYFFLFAYKQTINAFCRTFHDPASASPSPVLTPLHPSRRHQPNLLGLALSKARRTTAATATCMPVLSAKAGFFFLSFFLFLSCWVVRLVFFVLAFAPSTNWPRTFARTIGQKAGAVSLAEKAWWTDSGDGRICSWGAPGPQSLPCWMPYCPTWQRRRRWRRRRREGRQAVRRHDTTAKHRKHRKHPRHLISAMGPHSFMMLPPLHRQVVDSRWLHLPSTLYPLPLP